MEQKILVAPDKFKGSLSAYEICLILKSEILSVLPDAQVESCLLADGGDGSLDVLATYLDLEKQVCETVDPIGRLINSLYYTFNKTAYIELASASGLVLLDDSEKNPMLTSTYGTGLEILDAIDNGIENIYLFLGGSATNDGGMGIAKAIGYTFYDQFDEALKPIGASLNLIKKIVPPKRELKIKTLKLCCDVANRPYGSNGAAYVYGSQKGASMEQIIELDAGLENLCNEVKNYSGIDLSELKGGGAAGGVATCLYGLLEAEIVSGFNMISQVSKLESKIANSDIIISGEGRLDGQSLNGKVISGVAEMCKKYRKRMLLVVGKNELSNEEIETLGVEKLFSVLEIAIDLQDAISNGDKYMKVIGLKIVDYLNSENI